MVPLKFYVAGESLHGFKGLKQKNIGPIRCGKQAVGEDTFKKYLKIQILYTQTYIYTDRQ